MLCTVPYGLLAERIRRKRVLILSRAGVFTTGPLMSLLGGAVKPSQVSEEHDGTRSRWAVGRGLGVGMELDGLSICSCGAIDDGRASSKRVHQGG